MSQGYGTPSAGAHSLGVLIDEERGTPAAEAMGKTDRRGYKTGPG